MAASKTPQSESAPHVASLGMLIGTFAALMVLTAVTVAMARVDLGGNANVLAALAVASVKATLVALFFMHLKGDKRANSVTLVGALFFLALFIGFSVFDTTNYQPSMIAPAASGAKAKATATASAPATASPSSAEAQ